MNYLRTLFLVAAAMLPLCLCSCGKGGNAPSAGGTMTINSNPDKAKISILGQDVGVTPKTTKEVDPGMYIVKVEKEGFAPVWKPVRLEKGKNTAVDFTLRPLVSVAMISSLPAGAKIEKDGQIVGITPCVLTNLALGRHAVRVTMPGFAPREITWDVTGDRPFAAHLDLVSNTGTLQIDSTPGDAKVLIDGKNHGLTPVSEKVEQGEHTVRIERHGYEPCVTSVTVRRNAKEVVNVALKLTPIQLKIESNPSGAQVFIDEKEYGLTPYVFQASAPGKYTVTLRKDNFSKTGQEVVLTPGNPAELMLALESELGSLEFITAPAGVTVFLDGKKYGKTLPNPNDPNSSELFRIDAIPMGKHKLEIVHERGIPPRITETVSIRKGETTRLAKPVRIWVPNAVLKLKNKMSREGRVLDFNAEPLVLEPNPNTKISYFRKEIEKIIPIKD